MHGARSVPRASSAERVLLVPEPGKPVVASFALEIPLVIRPLGACCNSRSLKSGRKRKKRPTHESRFPLRPRPTATPWPVPWLAEAMAELRHAIGIDRRRTRAQVVQPPCTVGVVGRRKTTCISFCAISSCCGHAYANPDDSAHGDTCGACADHEFSLIGRPVQEEIAQKDCS
jgi:hypothetical protein